MSRAPIRLLPSRETLVELLSYAPDTGELLWKARDSATEEGRRFNARFASKPAGGLSTGRQDGSNRYLVVGLRIDGRQQQFGAHRIIFKMMTGLEPPAFVDHHDGDELNLRWENLRPATNGQNIQNSKLRKDNKSGVKGVCWDRGRGKWLAVIGANKRYVKVGRFDSVKEAAAAIEKARLELHGEFARVA